MTNNSNDTEEGRSGFEVVHTCKQSTYKPLSYREQRC